MHHVLQDELFGASLAQVRCVVNVRQDSMLAEDRLEGGALVAWLFIWLWGQI